MKRFWIIAVNGVAHTLNERFYSYADAKIEAARRAKMSPNNTFLILSLKSYVIGKNHVKLSWNDHFEDITATQNTPTLVSVELTDINGEPLNLDNLRVQFIILPTRYSDDSSAIFNETKRWVDPSVDPYPYDGFKSNVVEYIVPASNLPYIADYWYQVRITYDNTPDEPTVYKEGDFFVIEDIYGNQTGC